ncbi:hypothetical protein [Streptomyces sp. NPDC051001]|uniref:hypothetical protein n=1 Tax=Streptomyces sp. NPDC051001 TaxID=3155795 RepID=UPI0034409350
MRTRQFQPNKKRTIFAGAALVAAAAVFGLSAPAYAAETTMTGTEVDWNYANRDAVAKCNSAGYTGEKRVRVVLPF